MVKMNGNIKGKEEGDIMKEELAQEMLREFKGSGVKDVLKELVEKTLQGILHIRN